MKSRVVWVFFIVFGACLPEPKVPDAQKVSVDSLLTQKQMVALLVDMHMAEARTVQSRVNGADTVQAFYNEISKRVFLKHKTDTGIYNRSFRYYSTIPNLMDSIYTEVLDSLGVLESTAPPLPKL